MITVTNLNGSATAPLNIKHIQGFDIHRKIDGTLTVSLTSFPDANNPAHTLLEPEGIITVAGYGDFKIKQYSDGAWSKHITAVSTFFELKKSFVYGELNGTKTLAERVAFALAGSGWTYSIDAAVRDKTALINKFGKANRVALVTDICKYYSVEYEIQDGNHVHFAEQIGPDNNFPYRYNHNVSDVVLTFDTDNLYTTITGIGRDGLTVTYRSPNADIFGELEHDPIEDDRFTDANSLREYIKLQLNDAPTFAIESRAPAMTQRSIGERVWLTHEPLGFNAKTRITEQHIGIVNGQLMTTSVIFGNTLLKNAADAMVEQMEQHMSLNNEAVKQEQEYNGASVSNGSGLRVRSGVVETIANALEGFKITNGDMVKFWVDVLGNLLMDGQLRVTSGGVTMLEAFMDTLGGRLILNDIAGRLNVKIGSEESGGSQSGGIVKLYDDGEGNLRVELGALAAYGGNGAVTVYSSGGSPKAGIYALTDSLISGMVYVNNAAGQAVTTLTASEGKINNEKIATETWANGQFARGAGITQYYNYNDNSIEFYINGTYMGYVALQT